MHRPVDDEAANIDVGEVREGVVTGANDNGCLVDVGVDQPLKVDGRGPSKGSRVTVKVQRKRPLTGRPVKKSQLDDYWGYDLRGSRARLGELALSAAWDPTLG